MAVTVLKCFKWISPYIFTMLCQACCIIIPILKREKVKQREISLLAQDRSGHEPVTGEVDRAVAMGWNFSGVETGLLWTLQRNRKGRV